MSSLYIPYNDEAISVFLKLPGEVCNINCHYCFEKRKPNGSYKNINPSLLGEFLEKANGRPLVLELHGGEPLILGKEKIKELINECKKYKGPLRLRLQTNAILLDQEWIDMFKKEWPEIEISTSLDGDPISTSHRVDYNNNPTISKVEKALKLLEENNIKIGLICTVTKPALNRYREILEYFSNFNNLSLLKINPCFDLNVNTPITKGNKETIDLLNPKGEGVPGWGVTPTEYAIFLKNLFEEWVNTGLYKKLYIEPFLSILRVIGGKGANFCVYNEKKCANMMTLYPDGRIGSCDELDYPEAVHTTIDKINSLDEIIEFQKNKNLLDSFNIMLQKCDGCSYKATCNGGCLATRKRYYNTPLYEEYCQYRMSIIDHIKDYVSEEVIVGGVK